MNSNNNNNNGGNQPNDHNQRLRSLLNDAKKSRDERKHKTNGVTKSFKVLIDKLREQRSWNELSGQQQAIIESIIADTLIYVSDIRIMDNLDSAIINERIMNLTKLCKDQVPAIKMEIVELLEQHAYNMFINKAKKHRQYIGQIINQDLDRTFDNDNIEEALGGQLDAEEQQMFLQQFQERQAQIGPHRPNNFNEIAAKQQQKKQKRQELADVLLAPEPLPREIFAQAENNQWANLEEEKKNPRIADQQQVSQLLPDMEMMGQDDIISQQQAIIDDIIAKNRQQTRNNPLNITQHIIEVSSSSSSSSQDMQEVDQQNDEYDDMEEIQQSINYSMRQRNQIRHDQVMLNMGEASLDESRQRNKLNGIVDQLEKVCENQEKQLNQLMEKYATQQNEKGRLEGELAYLRQSKQKKNKLKEEMKRETEEKLRYKFEAQMLQQKLVEMQRQLDAANCELGIRQSQDAIKKKQEEQEEEQKKREKEMEQSQVLQRHKITAMECITPCSTVSVAILQGSFGQLGARIAEQNIDYLLLSKKKARALLKWLLILMGFDQFQEDYHAMRQICELMVAIKEQFRWAVKLLKSNKKVNSQSMVDQDFRMIEAIDFKAIDAQIARFMKRIDGQAVKGHIYKEFCEWASEYVDGMNDMRQQQVRNEVEQMKQQVDRDQLIANQPRSDLLLFRPVHGSSQFPYHQTLGDYLKNKNESSLEFSQDCFQFGPGVQETVQEQEEENEDEEEEERSEDDSAIELLEEYDQQIQRGRAMMASGGNNQKKEEKKPEKKRTTKRSRKEVEVKDKIIPKRQKK